MSVFMEQIGDSQDPYVVLEWFCDAGDLVTEGQVLCAVEVGKANVDVVAPASGLLESIAVEADQECLPGDLLCTIRSQ